MVNVSYEVIEDWQWLVMVMDFVVFEDVDIFQFGVGVLLYMEIDKFVFGLLFIIGIYIMFGMDYDIMNNEDSSEVLELDVQLVIVDGVINMVDVIFCVFNILCGVIEKWGCGLVIFDFVVDEVVVMNVL